MLVKFILILFVFNISSIANGRKIPVDRHIYLAVEKLVLMGMNLQEASYKRDKNEIPKLMAKIIKHINASKEIIVNDNVGAQYFLELLDTIKNQSTEAQGLQDQAQRDALKTAFQKIAEITQKYYVGNYRQFYCQKSKVLWVQRHWQAKNPVNPKSRCGVLVN